MPVVVSTIVDVYVYRLVGYAPEFLLLKRTGGAVLGGTWQLVHGHVAAGESAVQTAIREVREETGLTIEKLHQLESVNTFFLAALDEIHICPGLAARVGANDIVTLNDEHSAFEWVSPDAALARLMWPGLRHGLGEVMRDILPGGAASEARCIRLPE